MAEEQQQGQNPPPASTPDPPSHPSETEPQKQQHGQHTSSNRRHHHRGGRGGRGGRSGRDRHSHQQSKGEVDETKITSAKTETEFLTTNSQNSVENDVEKEHFQLLQSLKALHHPNPKSVLPCLTVPSRRHHHHHSKQNKKQDQEQQKEKEKEVGADEVLANLVFWLENTIIRQWDPKSRIHLQQNSTNPNLWFTIQKYLYDLDCPPLYYIQPPTRDGFTAETYVINEEKLPTANFWRYNEGRRNKVITWIISCGVSQLYEDCVDELSLSQSIRKEEEEEDVVALTEDVEEKLVLSSQQPIQQEKKQQQSSASITNTNDNPNSSPKDQQQAVWNEETFPLGFTTNDSEIDKILTVLRMRYILELRKEQNKMNEKIAEMQALHCEL